MTDNKKRPSAEIITPGLGEIEKVRDILFGRQVTDFQERFSVLESRLEADVDELKQRLSDKIDSMDKAVNKSLAKLDKKIASEESSRDTELNSLQAALASAEKSLQHAIAEMEDQANQDLQAARATFESSHQDLIDSTTAAQKALSKQLLKQKDELEQDKVGRQSLALMLDEVAIKLRGS